MPRALKVYRMAVGFHDAYVAAPSQKAAAEAWGSDIAVFARGEAELVTDPKLMEEPLANPGKVIKRLRGTAEDRSRRLGPPRRRPRVGKAPLRRERRRRRRSRARAEPRWTQRKLRWPRPKPRKPGRAKSLRSAKPPWRASAQRWRRSSARSASGWRRDATRRRRLTRRRCGGGAGADRRGGAAAGRDAEEMWAPPASSIPKAALADDREIYTVHRQ